MTTTVPSDAHVGVETNNADVKKTTIVSPTGQLRSPPRSSSEKVDSGLLMAQNLVQSIYEQITFHDSPHVNVNVASMTYQNSTFIARSDTAESTASLTTQQSSKLSSGGNSMNRLERSHRQKHVLPTIYSPISSPTSADMGDSSLLISGSPAPEPVSSSIDSPLPSTITTPVMKSDSLPPPPTSPGSISRNFSMALREPGNGAEVAMGNLSLAALCVRTVDSLNDHLQKSSTEHSKPVDSTSGHLMSTAPPQTAHGVSNADVINRNKNSWESDMEISSSLTDEDLAPGAFQRKYFLNRLKSTDSADEYLFPDTKILMESGDDDEMLDLRIVHSKEDGVVMKSIVEENEANEDDGEMNGNKNNHSRDDEQEEIPSFLKGVMDQDGATSRGGNEHVPSPEVSKLAASPQDHPPRPRIQMFGSEYARHLASESPFSPVVLKAKSRKSSFGMRKEKKVSNTVMSSAAASSTMSISTSQSSAPDISGINSIVSTQENTVNDSHGGNMSVSTMSNASISMASLRTVCLEDCSSDILSAAITDIVVTHGNEMPPKGYYRITQTSNGVDLETLKSMQGGIGKKKHTGVFLNVKKEPKWDRAVQRPCVTAMTVIFPDRNEFVPPGFCVVRKYKGPSASDKKHGSDTTVKDDDDFNTSSSSYPANLNYGTSGERVYLCYRRSREGNPITGLIPLQPSNQEAVPEGYTVLERSPRNFVADINSKAGPPLFLAFRQRLANLETLRPLPMVLSVHYANMRNLPKTNGEEKSKRLKAYYCTGGTVVPSDVGKYHVMDRSTHPLISPSSVTNRLSLIQASRYKSASEKDVSIKKSDRSPSPMSLASGLVSESVTDVTRDFVPVIDTHDSESGVSLQNSRSFQSLDHMGNENETEEDSTIDDPASIPKENFVNGILHLVNSIAPKKSKSLMVGDMSEGNKMSSSTKKKEVFNADSTAKSSIFVSMDNANLQSCFNAMSFIPYIQCANPNKVPEDMNSDLFLQSRIAVISPILTACYTFHGGSLILAVEGLSKLLKDTDFFLTDVGAYDDPLVNDRLTLLDLAVQVVCDVGNGTAMETNFLPCVEFVSEAVYYAKGKLNSRTIGYIIRFYLFVFYFGASVPTSSSWPRCKTSGFAKKEALDEANDVLLLSEDELLNSNGGNYRSGYVPGGAPQAAALALKEFVSIFLLRLRKMSSSGREHVVSHLRNKCSTDESMRSYLESLVDGAVHQVDVANFTQLALHQIHRSGGSELFWHDMMSSCGSGLFGTDPTTTTSSKHFFTTSFSILASLVKVSSGKVRKLSQSTEFVPRDVASKLLSLELLHHFLRNWAKVAKSMHSKQMKAAKEGIQKSDSPSMTTMAYAIRRLVVPCLLSNTRAGLDDIKIFRRIMKIVSELWCNDLIRKHMKIEIGVLIEHFVLKILRLGPQVLIPKRLSNRPSSTLDEMSVALLPQQVCVVNEVKTWFLSEPRDILELYMNFDQVDAESAKRHFSLLPSSHWKITQQLCGAVCTLAEQCTEIVSDQIRLTRIDLAEMDTQSATAQDAHHSEVDLREMTLVREGARYLQEKCFEAMAQIVRSLMLCAATSSGDNCNLLSKLRDKQDEDNVKPEAISVIQNQVHPDDIAVDENSSIESDENMTVNSVLEIGNIVGGIMNIKRDSVPPPERLDIPKSPVVSRQFPQLTINDDDGDIVEYWQTSIAAERRKNQNTSASPGTQGSVGGAQKLPPRNKRSITRPFLTSTPPRNSDSTTLRNVSPIHGRSPRRDDASNISMTEESIRGSDPILSHKFEENLDTAFEILQTKSLKKALDYLIACNMLTPSPRDIASFLRLYQSRIDTAVLGDYLGEGGKDGDEVEHYNLIRFYYTSAISFVGLNVEQGLRHFLTNCGFRLPGEAQKIDRIISTFSQCYWEDNAGDSSKCPFQDQDTVFLISFAIIMLNTDLHKTSMFAAPPGQTVSKQKQRKKMTKEEFMKNLRGVDNSEDLSREYLAQIYDSIAANPIAIYRPNDSNSVYEGASGKKTIKFSSGEFGHIIQGNIDLAGMIKHTIKSVKPNTELLRGLAAHEHPYLSIRNRKYNKKKSRKHVVPEELVRSAFCSLWHHFHGTINTALDSAHLDPKGLENSLDVLMYTLCTTICLDLTVERNAFATQLVRVKFFRENRGLEEDDSEVRPVTRIRDHLDYKNDRWYQRIEKAAESYNENAKVAALDEVDGMFKKLHASLKVDSALKREMIKIARSIRNGQILLNDPTRYFIKESELIKKSNRTGRHIKYTFILFSDVLIYAHKSGNELVIHGELPLHLMKLLDLDMKHDKKSKQKRSFYVIHPRKKFVVLASDLDEKVAWYNSINQAIDREVRRKARIESARQNSAAIDR